MGCISSKFVARSILLSCDSYEGQTPSLKRTAVGVPELEELNFSCHGGDHYLALVRAANMVVNKLHSRDSNSNSCSKPDIGPARTETMNTREMMATLDQGVVIRAKPAPEEVESIDIDLAMRRSKSCHWFPEHGVSSIALEIPDDMKEEKSSWSYKGMARSRSAHTDYTVEYEAMLETIGSGVQQRWLDGKDYSPGINTQFIGSKTSLNMSHHAEGKEESSLQEMKQSLQDEALVHENTTKNFLRSETETKEVMQSSNYSSSSPGQENQEVIPCSHSISEKGLKRKALAKGLELLRIPPTFEFPANLSPREWLHVGGQVSSPASYITPKFGSYSLPIHGTRSECNEDFIFNPELVAAYEQCMHQLEAEEESLLKQIVESSDEDYTKDEQAKEEILFH
ncbi:hypothetical protein CIPAW_09G113300 [Carya illinoinensis]|uniref:Uncharacterized protein n=1 Tax=Carya illinoinensis TaxID=32201 RepID=A0A8T1PJM9_CARIL|nr:hypothetical protein CIPAW_09G113300 [Carya illinoinensis]